MAQRARDSCPTGATGTGLTRSRVLVLTLTLPAVLVAVTGVWALVTNPEGGWLWAPDQVTMPEAVATGNYGELGRQLSRGLDPNPAAPVRAGLLGPQPVMLTPLQASIWARNARMTHLLLDAGAVAGPTGVAILHCMNALHGNDETAAALNRLGPPAATPCESLDVPR